MTPVALLSKSAIAVTLGLGVAATVFGIVVADSSPPPISAVSFDGTSTTVGGDDGDISGPCDEAEHATDPRCTGSSPTTRVTRGGGGGPSPSPSPSTTSVTRAGADISGPCDEAEHANDPRCTGATAGDGDRDESDDDDDDDEERSGSRHGGDDPDDSDDDRSGPGGGGDRDG